MSWFRSQIAALASRDTARLNNHLRQSPVLPKNEALSVIEADSSLKLFELFWHDASAILSKPFSASDKSHSRTSTIDDCEIVIHFTDKMVKMLTDDCVDSFDPQLLDYFYSEEVLNKLRTFSWQRPEYRSRLLLHQLSIYDALIGHSQQLLLLQKQFTEPLLKLLNDCKNEQMKDESLEEKLLAVLHQLCIAVTQDMSLLNLLIESDDVHDPDSRIFDLSMLVPYVHRVGTAGQQARDDLLLLISLSCNHGNIGKYITEKTDFCQILVVSLSGLYSSLPRVLTYGSDDWHCITEEDIANSRDLQMILNLLEFCNALVQVSHPVIQDQLLNFIYSGFLVSVLGPTLHQFDTRTLSKNLNSRFGDALLLLLVQSGMEEAIAVTAYLDLFVRKITEPLLLKIFLRFILQGKMEETTVLEALIQRINSHSMRLCIVTLTLFKTLVELNCEDVMYQLVFKYLLPCTHIMVSQQRSVTSIDLYCKTAEKLISLIPAGLHIENNGISGCSTERNDDSFRFGTNQSKEEEGFINPEKTSSQRNGVASARNSHLWESHYLECLRQARVSVGECMQACRNWSSAYAADSRTISSVSSPSSSAVTDMFSSDVPDADLPGGGKKHGSADASETASSTCDEVFGSSGGQAVVRPGDDMLSFLVRLNRISMPEGSDTTEDVVTEFVALLDDVKDRLDLVVELSDLSRSSSFQDPSSASGSGISRTRSFHHLTEGSISNSLPSCITDSDGLDVGGMSLSPGKDETRLKVPIVSSKSYMGTAGTPTVGPFLTALLNKLESMKQNTLYVNLQLTGLVAKLACFPQPLLSSLLLSHSLVFQPSVKSLVQVLNTVKCRIEEFLYKVKEKDQLLEQAYNFLHWRESCQERRDSRDLSSVPSRRHSLLAATPKPSGDTKPSVISRLRLLDNSRGAYFSNKQPRQTPQAVQEAEAVVETKNAIYCAVIFREFLLELAAISQEHALLILTEDVS